MPGSTATSASARTSATWFAQLAADRPDDRVRPALQAPGPNRARQPGPKFRAVVETAPPYSVAEQVRIPMAIRREHADLFHAPHYVLPPLINCRSVVTIHDTHPPDVPAVPAGPAGLRVCADVTLARHAPLQPHPHRFRNVEDRHPAAVPSPGRQITVVYNAIDERLSKVPTEEAFERVRIRYQLRDPFALYVGNIKPHKNLERLIDAFDLRRRQPGFDSLKLVIIGDEISKYQGLRRAVHHFKLHKHVRFFGFVPGRYPLGAVPARERVRLPVALRRLRPAAARGDGERDARRHLERLVPPRGRRRRGDPRRPVRSRLHCAKG